MLYYLEGRSYAEAASLLGVPEATVRGRLARARERLRDRLVPPLVSSVPAVPPGLIALTARAASCVTLAPPGATASSIVLMREVLGAMIVSKLKVAASGLAAVCALAWMTASLAAPAAQDEPRPRAIVSALPPNPGPEPRIRTVFLYVRPRGNRAAALRVTEYLTKEISQGTKLRVVGNPEEADLILEGRSTRLERCRRIKPAGPRP